jgi:hypothetical protein
MLRHAGARCTIPDAALQPFVASPHAIGESPRLMLVRRLDIGAARTVSPGSRQVSPVFVTNKVLAQQLL